MKKIVAALLITTMMVLAGVSAASATPEKARQTGKSCKDCHPNAGPHKHK